MPVTHASGHPAPPCPAPTVRDVVTEALAPAGDLESAVYQALGMASMCWDPAPAGVFDAERAAIVGETLLAELRRRPPPGDAIQ